MPWFYSNKCADSSEYQIASAQILDEIKIWWIEKSAYLWHLMGRRFVQIGGKWGLGALIATAFGHVTGYRTTLSQQSRDHQLPDPTHRTLFRLIPRLISDSINSLEVTSWWFSRNGSSWWFYDVPSVSDCLFAENDLSAMRRRERWTNLSPPIKSNNMTWRFRNKFRSNLIGFHIWHLHVGRGRRGVVSVIFSIEFCSD